MFCKNCGAGLKDNSQFCPQCGAPVKAAETEQKEGLVNQTAATPSVTDKGNKKAVASLVLGIVGLLAWLLPVVGLPVTIVGMSFGIIERQSAKRKIAIIGLVFSIVGLCASVGNAALGAFQSTKGRSFSDLFGLGNYAYNIAAAKGQLLSHWFGADTEAKTPSTSAYVIPAVTGTDNSSGKVAPESDFNVGLTEDSEGVVIKRYLGNGGKIIIPSQIQGMPVREIGPGAFGFDSVITSVTIPDGVTSIGEKSFYRLTSLKSVVIPAGVTYIGRWAFDNDESLATADVPSGIKYIGSWAFSDTGLTDVIIYANTNYEDSVYTICKALTSVTIQDGVTVIPARMFYGCSALKTISIPDSVKKIGSAAFDDCSGLTSVVCSPDIERDWWTCFERCKKLDLASQAALRKAGYMGSF